MKTHGVLGSVATATLLALITGCGGSDDPPAAQGGTGGSGATAGKVEAGGGTSAAGEAGEVNQPEGGAPAGGTGGTGGGGGSTAGSAGTGGAPPITRTFKSKPAGIELTLAPTSAAGLSLATTSITQDTGGSLFYTEWLGELFNDTDEPQCLIQMSGDFQDASGTTVIKFDTYAYGAPYKIGTSALVSSCIPPHEGMPVWSNDLPGKALAIASIKKLVVEITPFETTIAIPHPSTPTLGAITKTYNASFGEWSIAGSATATANIYNASLTFWGKSGDFYVDNQKVYHLEDLLKGTTWAFDTKPLGLETDTLSSVLPLFSFIDGLKGATASIHTLDPQTAAIMRRRNDALTAWQNAADLRARFRSAAR